MSCALYRSSLIELARGSRIDSQTTLHVDGCESCQDFLAAQRMLTVSARNVAASAAMATLPEGLERVLLAEFDSVHRTRKHPATFWLTAGAFALTAAAMVTVVLLKMPLEVAPEAPKPVAVVLPQPPAPAPTLTPTPAESPTVAVARPVTLPPRPLRTRPKPKQEDTQEASFISIPYTMPLAPNERADVVRMDVPVAALIAAGLPMRVQDMSANASADVLVGEDGRARAVRLISVADSNFNRSFK